MLGAARAVAWALLLATGALAGWMPDEDAIPPANRTWLERIADELDRSLTVYRRPKNVEEAENLVFRLLDDPERSVLVLGRTVLVDRRLFVRPNKKGLLHLEFLRSLLERGASGNVAYLWEWSADGFKSQDQLIREGCPAPKRMGSGKTEVKPKSWIYQKQKGRPELPYLAIAKRYGYDQCGILIPNCYFDSRDWDETVAGIVNSNATKIPLEAKDKRVFWRGAIRNEMAVPKGRCVLEGGNFARAEAVALSVAKPDLFDIKCQEKCTPRDDVKMPCSEFTFDPTTRAALKKLKSIKSDYVPRDDFGRYQYLLNLPGSVSGSYSRNLNHLWLVGSVVALWDAPYVEFYYPALAAVSPEGTAKSRAAAPTHVALDRKTAEATLAALTPKLREELVKNAKKVADELLCPGCQANYWRLVIAKMREHFRFDLVLDDAPRLLKVLDKLNFTKRRLVAFHSGRKGTSARGRRRNAPGSSRAGRGPTAGCCLRGDARDDGSRTRRCRGVVAIYPGTRPRAGALHHRAEPAPAPRDRRAEGVVSQRTAAERRVEPAAEGRPLRGAAEARGGGRRPARPPLRSDAAGRPRPAPPAAAGLCADDADSAAARAAGLRRRRPVRAVGRRAAAGRPALGASRSGRRLGVG